jgi:hypothetical protein
VYLSSVSFVCNTNFDRLCGESTENALPPGDPQLPVGEYTGDVAIITDTQNVTNIRKKCNPFLTCLLESEEVAEEKSGNTVKIHQPQQHKQHHQQQ